MIESFYVSPEKVAAGSVSLDWVDLNKAGEIFFVEGRPQEGGRGTLLSINNLDQIVEATPSPFNVRSKVHEYGGKSYCLPDKGAPFFVNFKDQALYQGDQQLTDGTVRLVDMIVVPGGIIAVAEGNPSGEVDNYLAFFNLETKELTSLFSGWDFVAAPSLSPDGKKLTWISWNHPNMPWQGTTLWVAGWDDQTLVDPKALYGGDHESIFQPGWSPTGELLYISDRTGFWNLYKDEESLFPIQADCGKPLWVLGTKTWDFEGEDLVLSFQDKGSWKLAHNGKILPFEAADISSLTVREGMAYFAASFKDERRKIVSYNLKTDEVQWLYGEKLDLKMISLPENISFPSGDREIPAFYYPPMDKTIKKPPLLVRAHGGPTGQSTPSFNWTYAYWTGLGFAILDVNYTGSTGYGREFREALNGHWGTFDWQDCEAGARYLVEKGLVDPNALFISGGSAGGFTVLTALTLGTLFKGGTSYFGVSDLNLLAEETHKFESRYFDSLIGPVIVNPPFHLLAKPVLFLQGNDDKVVPPDQSSNLYNVLKGKGIPTEYVLYAGESHGFKKKETIIDTLTREAAFYRKMMGKQDSEKNK
jgi:dipeptidyl aminopeptidase/acylaminoacyl peptidase